MKFIQRHHYHYYIDTVVTTFRSKLVIIDEQLISKKKYLNILENLQTKFGAPLNLQIIVFTIEKIRIYIFRGCVYN